MTKYVAMLRGINVGGNKKVKMDDLKHAFERGRFRKVRTILASGNVLFETDELDTQKIARSIEIVLKKELEMDIGTIVRPVDEIKGLIEKNPFRDIEVTPQTRLYVTFLSDEHKGKLKMLDETKDRWFTALSQSGTEVCSAITISKENGTVDLMKIIEKEFGKKITTRNWNTVLKMID